MANEGTGGLLSRAFHGKPKLFGRELESLFEKELYENIGGLLQQNRFTLRKFCSRDDDFGKSIVVSAYLENPKKVIEAHTRISIDMMYKFWENTKAEPYVIQRIFHDLVRSLEKQLHEYIDSTSINERRQNAGIVMMANPHLNAAWAEYGNVTSSFTDSYITSGPWPEEKPAKAKADNSPFKDISLLIKESKARLNKGPFKNLNWSFAHFK